MTATPDPLDRLRAADPASGAVSQPDPSLLEEILMTDTQTPGTQHPDAQTPGTPSPATEPHAPVPAGGPSTAGRPRLPLLLGVAAALLVVVGIVGAVLAGGGDDTTDQAGVDTGALPTNPDAGDDPAAGGVITEPGDPAAGSEVTSCVEQYSPETLAQREYAFDGTVSSVDGDTMTFTVNEWFNGGDADTITLDHQGYAGMLLDPNTPLDVGARALVAGDGGFVWSCGFTQLHTDAGAAEWRSATAG